jgi:hypothetical protein
MFGWTRDGKHRRLKESTMTTTSEMTLDADELIRVKLELALTRDQLRDFLGWSVVQQDRSVENNLTAIRSLVRDAVQVHIVSAEHNWDLLATEDQIKTVDRAVDRLAPKT